jgi:CheY-specific phosphatase CheX
MIMGNTATLFSTNDIHIDITPPISIMGAQLHLQSSTTALKVPLLDNGSELISLFLCLVRE